MGGPGGVVAFTPIESCPGITIAFLLFAVYSPILENFHNGWSTSLKVCFPVLSNFIATTIVEDELYLL